MTHAEQHKMVVALEDEMRRMRRDDYEVFGMFLKRDKDDEDLDVMSQKRLLQLYDQYVLRKGGSR